MFKKFCNLGILKPCAFGVIQNNLRNLKYKHGYVIMKNKTMKC